MPAGGTHDDTSTLLIKIPFRWSENLDWNPTKDLSCAIAMYIYLLIFVLLLIAFFDVYWILRLILTRLLSKVSIFLLVIIHTSPSWLLVPRTRIILIWKGAAKPLSGGWRCDLLTLLDDWSRLFLPHEQWQILQGNGLCQVGPVWRIQRAQDFWVQKPQQAQSFWKKFLIWSICESQLRI